jgi:hypothetical protein
MRRSYLVPHKKQLSDLLYDHTPSLLHLTSSSLSLVGIHVNEHKPSVLGARALLMFYSSPGFLFPPACLHFPRNDTQTVPLANVALALTKKRGNCHQRDDYELHGTAVYVKKKGQVCEIALYQPPTHIDCSLSRREVI